MQVTYLNMVNSKILTQSNKFDYLIVINAILLVLSLLLVNFSDIDLEIQKYLFNFDSKLWIVDKNEPLKKLIFYKLPKIIFGVVVVSFLVLSFLSFKKKTPFLFSNRHLFFLVLLGLVLIPLIAGNIKKFTNVYCPWQLEIYDGDKPYVRIFDSYPNNFQQTKKGQCFPAGHAVTGFAFFIFFFAFRNNLLKVASLSLAFCFGWVLGLYQMMKGAHFFGDTLVAMLICFLLSAIIARIYSKKVKYD